MDEFGNKIKFILDGGNSEIGIESTIVSLINKPEILRLGGIEIAKIKKILNLILNIIAEIIKFHLTGEKIHYSPGI